jgi:hypothetical protein
MNLYDLKFKGIGRRIGQRGGGDDFDPDAEDGDGDKRVQDNTKFERVAPPKKRRKKRSKKESPLDLSEEPRFNIIRSRKEVTPSLVELLRQRIILRKGFTINSNTLEEQITGIAVSLPNLGGEMRHNEFLEDDEIARRFIVEYLRERAESFDDDGATHIGGWVFDQAGRLESAAGELKTDIENLNPDDYPALVVVDAGIIVPRSVEAARRMARMSEAQIMESRLTDPAVKRAMELGAEYNQEGIFDIDAAENRFKAGGEDEAAGEDASRVAYIQTGGDGGLSNVKYLVFDGMEMKSFNANRNGILTTEDAEYFPELNIGTIRSQIKNRRRAAAANARSVVSLAETSKKTRRSTPRTSERYEVPSESLTQVIRHHYTGNPAQIATKRFALDFCVLETKGRVSSLLIPGSSGLFRNPVRSLGRRALMPGGSGAPGGGMGGGGMGGGGLGRTIGKVPITSHCPTGFQFGGRFSDRQLSNCGEQLFVPPGDPEGPIGQVTRLKPSGISPDKAKLTKFGIVGGAELPALSATISRNADVGRVGAANTGNSDSAVTEALSVAGRMQPPFTRLIRKDGVALDSRVSVDRLVSQTSNVDMQGGTIVSRVSDTGVLGNSEVGLFSAGISSVRFAIPGGQEIRVDAPSTLTTADKRNINRQWATLKRSNTADNGSVPLQNLVAQSKGKLTYSETFKGIERPTELVSLERGKAKRTTPRWVAESFLTESAPGRNSSTQPWKETGVIPTLGGSSAVETSTQTLSSATKLLDDNAPLASIPAAFRPNAIAKSDSFTSTPIGAGRTLLTRSNGEKFISREGSPSSAFADKVSADLMKAVGISTPDVLTGGTGSKRTTFTSSVESAVPQGSLSTGKSLSDADPESLVKIALMDYVLAQSDRSPSSIALMSGGGKIVPVPTSSGSSLLANMNHKMGTPSTVAAIVRKPQEILSTDAAWASKALSESSGNLDNILADAYASLLKSLSSFDWESYAARLGADGTMSKADKLHLEVIKRLVSSRLSNLKSSHKRLAQIMGVVA